MAASAVDVAPSSVPVPAVDTPTIPVHTVNAADTPSPDAPLPSAVPPHDDSAAVAPARVARVADAHLADSLGHLGRTPFATTSAPGYSPPTEVPLNFVHPHVETLTDAMSWADDFLRVVEELFPPGILLDLKDKIESSSRSSAFSGIDAPGAADNVIATSLADKLGTSVNAMPFLSAVEIDGPCIEELRNLPVPPAHIFGDIEQFWVPAIHAEINKYRARGEDMPLASFVAIAKTKRFPRVGFEFPVAT